MEERREGDDAARGESKPDELVCSSSPLLPPTTPPRSAGVAARGLPLRLREPNPFAQRLDCRWRPECLHEAARCNWGGMSCVGCGDYELDPEIAAAELASLGRLIAESSERRSSVPWPAQIPRAGRSLGVYRRRRPS